MIPKAEKAEPSFEQRFANFGRRAIETRLNQRRDASIRRKMGTVAMQHIYSSAGELQERLLEVLKTDVKGPFTSDEIDAELKRLGY